MGKFNLNIGPGTTIGAMAIGAGATAESNIGGPQTAEGVRLRVSVDMTNTTRAEAVKRLHDLIYAIEAGCTKTGHASDLPVGKVAWSVKTD